MATQYACKSCSAALFADQIDRDRRIAHCEACGAVFLIHPEAGHAGPPPANVDIHLHADHLKVVRRWYQPRMWLFLMMAVSWFGIVAGFQLMAFEGGPAWRAIMGLNVVFGIVLLYGALAGLINRTKILVGNGRLTKQHYPLPWRGRLNLETDQIDQFYCTEGTEFQRGRTRPVYQLNVFLNNGSRYPILRHVDSLETILFLENQIEQFLEIEDRPVDGETFRKFQRQTALSSSQGTR